MTVQDGVTCVFVNKCPQKRFCCAWRCCACAALCRRSAIARLGCAAANGMEAGNTHARHGPRGGRGASTGRPHYHMSRTPAATHQTQQRGGARAQPWQAITRKEGQLARAAQSMQPHPQRTGKRRHSRSLDAAHSMPPNSAAMASSVRAADASIAEATPSSAATQRESLISIASTAGPREGEGVRPTRCESMTVTTDR